MNSELEREAFLRHWQTVKDPNIGLIESRIEQNAAWKAWQARAALSTEAHYEEQPDGTITPVDPADMAQPEVTGAVYTVPIEVENDEVLYRLQDHPEPRSDCGVLYPPSAIEAAVREKLDEAAKEFEGRITDTDSPYDNALQYCANRIRAQRSNAEADTATQAMQAIIDLSAAPAPSPCTPKEAEELAKQTLGYFPKKSHLISCITFNELAAIINADRSKR